MGLCGVVCTKRGVWAASHLALLRCPRKPRSVRVEDNDGCYHSYRVLPREERKDWAQEDFRIGTEQFSFRTLLVPLFSLSLSRTHTHTRTRALYAALANGKSPLR